MTADQLAEIIIWGAIINGIIHVMHWTAISRLERRIETIEAYLEETDDWNPDDYK